MPIVMTRTKSDGQPSVPAARFFAHIIAVQELLIQSIVLLVEAHGDVKPGDILAVMSDRARKTANANRDPNVSAEIEAAIADLSNEVLYAIDARKDQA